MKDFLLDTGDEEKFHKLGIESLLGLAILAPTSFEDRRLLPKIGEHGFYAIDATIESVNRTPRSMQIRMFAHNFNHVIDGVLFKPKPYMLRQFVIGERHYFYGKIECHGGHCQMIHPQKVSSVGALISKYKTALRTDVMNRLVKKYLSFENLVQCGIPNSIAQTLVDIHFPRDRPLYEKGAWSDDALHALKYAELFDYMMRLKRKRLYFPTQYVLDGDWRNWSRRLPFELTEDQQHAIEAIAQDLGKRTAARRMIVGDVGSGKTMVILASVMIALPHRSILMAPTTILANQLYEEARKFLPDIAITLVTNKSKKEDLSPYQFIIGTHALLYRELPESALIMIDEQHRFGTQQRNQLEKMISDRDTRAHVLQFSATPIPRTQAMIDSAHIDVSLIMQTPFKKDIDTRIIRKQDFHDLMQHIQHETDENRQVLIVYPLVEQSEMLNYQSIDEARHFWETRFDNVFVTHGKDREKEAVLMNFRDHGTILLATTVVEVGISLPRLSTVVIVGAERLGLSTLHQLRGRVSRTGLKGYCYLFTHQNSSERLESFAVTQSGFDIAKLDLQYRQSGDLLTGRQQSGKKFRWVNMGEDEEVVKQVKAALQP